MKRFLLVTISVFTWAMSAAALGLQFEQPHIEGFHPLDEEPYEASPLNSKDAVILKLNTKLFKDTSVVDFEKRQITFRRSEDLGFTMWEYHFAELSDYLASRRNFIVYKSWYRDVLAAKRVDKKQQQQALKMQWELPVQYPTWAQRVLGNEPPRLKIDGNLTINMGFDRSTLTQGADSKDEKNANNDFKFNINYQFGISGTVGKLINVSIRVVDDELMQENNFKNFKIEYKESTPGEMEDEIIQEVIAGWTNFEMPGTQLSGYSGSKDGLFGIKIKSKLGPLTLTTIASQEKGEVSKQSYPTQKGGGSTPLEIDNYRKYKYFFVDTLFRSYYNRNHALTKKTNSVIPPPKIDTLLVFMRLDQSQVQSQANTVGPIKASDSKDEKQWYWFKKLVEGSDYYKDNEGWIRFDTAINPGSHIALYMRSSELSFLNRGEKVIVPAGERVYSSDSVRYEKLWTIKPAEDIAKASEDPARFYLMWRNVYDLDTNSLSSFELSIKRKKDGETDSSDVVPVINKKISYVLGLTDENGKPLISDTKMYERDHGFIIIPPYDTCSTCNEPFNNPALGEGNRDSVLYRYNSRDLVQGGDKPFYSIATTGKKQQKEFSLGWQVMPGTELVKTYGGEVLERNRDYIVDYESGVLELISPRALAAEGVDITCQRESMFVPESKVFLGVRGQVDLPFLSEKSFIGASMLFQNAGSNDIPRLEQEPYSKLLFDVNAKIDLEPEWMTELVDRLPFVQTEAPSSAVFEFETAHSRTNPNTNNEAYLDDFEDSKKTYPLGLQHESWGKASPPYRHLAHRSDRKVDTLSYLDSLYLFPPAWDFYWFYPRTDDNSFRDSVWIRSTTKATANEDRFDPVLRLHCKPAPDARDTTVTDLALRFKNAWAGIMYPLSQSTIGRNDYKYFEFVANSKNTNGKKLIVQMGVMNEDISINGGPPNKIDDREDSTRSGSADLRMDLGLDRKSDADEYYLIPGSSSNTWDTLRYNNRLLGDDKTDPGKDNARGANNKEYENDINNRSHASRLQGDERLTSEDIGYDGVIQTGIRESYYEFVIDLDDTTYIDNTAKVHSSNGWRKYRIPILDKLQIKDSVNNPLWTRVSTLRLIWTDFDSTSLNKEQQLLLTDLQFTGNYWQGQKDTTKITAEAKVLSNQEDLYYATNSTDSRIHRKKVQGTNDYELEQSLKIEFSNVSPGKSAVVKKNLQYQKMNISQYRKLTLLYFGDTSSGSHPGPDGLLYNGDLRFVFRFGNDDSTYYEFRDVIHRGWQQAVVDLEAIAKLKDRFIVANPGVAISDSLGNYKVIAKKIGTEPSIANVTWMALGVEFRNVNTTETYSGSVWVNEMKVDEISRLNDWATRISMVTKWADFLDVKASANYTGGDFRMMNETGYAAQSSKLQTSLSASMNVDKFLPRDWGVSIPLGGALSSDIDRPQLKKNSDARLHNDGIMDMVTDALAMIRKNDSVDVHNSSESEQYGSKKFTGNVYTNFAKSVDSDNPVVNLTADRITTNVSYSTSMTTDNLGPSSNGLMVHQNVTTTDDYIGKIGYDLSPANPPEWTKWRPFQNSKSPIPEPLKKYELSLLPSTFKFDLADVSYGNAVRRETKTGISSDITHYDLKHGFKFNYTPISPLLSIDYSVNLNRDLDSVATHGDGGDELDAVIKPNKEWERYLISFGEISRGQELRLNIKPEVVSWLTTDFEYSSAYSSAMVTQRNDKNLYLNATVRPRFTFNSTWQPSTMLNKLAELTKKTSAGKFFAELDTGYGKIGLRSITFTYSAETNLKNDYLSDEYLNRNDVGMDKFFLYQFGFVGREEGLRSFINGSMSDDELGGMRSRQKTDSLSRYSGDTKNIARKYSISTGLDLKFPFEISFSPISLEYSDNVNLTSRDTLAYDSTITFPKVAVGVNTNALMKLDLIKNYFKTFRCNTTYNYEKMINTTKTPLFKERLKSAWQPLISIYGDISSVPITITYSFELANTDEKLGTTQKDITSSTDDKSKKHEYSIKYEIQKNSRLSEIKFYKWTIPISGKTTIGLTGSHKSNVANKNYNDGKKSEKIKDINSFSISPRITYVFTDNIDGEIYYEGGRETDDGDNGTNSVRTTNKFAVILKVRL